MCQVKFHFLNISNMPFNIYEKGNYHGLKVTQTPLKCLPNISKIYKMHLYSKLVSIYPQSFLSISVLFYKMKPRNHIGWNIQFIEMSKLKQYIKGQKKCVKVTQMCTCWLKNAQQSGDCRVGWPSKTSVVVVALPLFLQTQILGI